MAEQIMIIKKSGEKEPFSDEKVLASMRRIGLPEELQPVVLKHIKERLHQNTQSSEVFSHILEFLEKNHKPSSLRFNLKRAIFDLGPTGFPFERYVARIFESQGYKVTVDTILQGDCVSHEVDVILEKDGKKEFVEAKFHNQQGVKTDVHVLLYTYARFLDLKEKHKFDGVWVVTNTKVTSESREYALCKGVKTLGWNFPTKGGLQDFVENPSMYPVTVLTELTMEEKKKLLEEDIILCSDLLKASDFVLKEKLLLNPHRVEEAKESARMITTTHHPVVEKRNEQHSPLV